MPSFRQQPVELVIDVRSKVEFWLGHLPEAVCHPVQTIAETLPSLPGITTQSRILVYCASGARSAAAAQQLRALGYQHVVDGGPMSTAQPDYTA